MRRGRNPRWPGGAAGLGGDRFSLISHGNRNRPPILVRPDPDDQEARFAVQSSPISRLRTDRDRATLGASKSDV